MKLFKLWLPYSIFIAGSTLSVLLWYFLLDESSRFYIHYAEWIVLIVGTSCALLTAISVRLIQLSREQIKSLNQAHQDFATEIKKEATERLHAEESKQKLEKALLQGQKLQAMGTLAGGIAHDFNNILYAIMGYVEMAREDVDSSSLVYKNLGKVLDASHRGQALIARILAFSRRQQHHDYQPIYLQETIESVLALLKPTIPASVNLEFHPTQQDYCILGDQTQLHQVIVNLINNAVDAMDGEGTITIQLQYIPANSDALNDFSKMDNANYCKIDITDTGHGMDQHTISRIFEPFFTTKEVGKGTGLGLATVHTIMKEHQGEIKVSSQIGLGTTFTLWLPEYEEKGE